ncbi:Putative LOC100902024, partial [Caligus rogercresseyi]
MPNKNPALWIEEHGGLDIWNYEQTKNILKCQVCNLAILYKQRIQHVKTSRHQKRLLLREKNSNITTDCSGQSSFNIGLARMLAACNIPVTKIENPAFIQFMEEHTEKIIPSRRVITKIIGKESQHVIDNIKEKIKDEDLFLLLDESKDPKGRAMTAVLIGPLDGRFDSRPYLINVVDIKEANSKTIVTTVVDNLQNVLGEHFSPSRFKLLVTDEAAYCVKAAKSLKTSFPEMIHVTCLAHGIHRVAELVRFQFPNVNELISEVKK